MEEEIDLEEDQLMEKTVGMTTIIEQVEKQQSIRVKKGPKKDDRQSFFGKLFSYFYKFKPTRHVIKKFIFAANSVPTYYFIKKISKQTGSLKYKLRLVSKEDQD